MWVLSPIPRFEFTAVAAATTSSGSCCILTHQMGGLCTPISVC